MNHNHHDQQRDHHPADVPAPVPPGPDPLGLPLVLGDLAPGRDLAGTPAITPDGDTVVVLDYDGGDVALADVWSLHYGTRTLPTHTRVSAVPDGQAFPQLCRALTHLVDSLRDLRTDRAVDRARHQRLLTEIRTYAIDRHLDGEYSRQGLNDFLARFDLTPYQPRYTVTYTITGSYQVEATPDHDEHAARRDAEQTLHPDLSGIPRLVDDCDSFDVHIEAVTPDDDRDHPPR